MQNKRAVKRTDDHPGGFVSVEVSTKGHSLLLCECERCDWSLLRN
jgi:hypothetical protein